LSVHDLSEGGLAVDAAAEMAFGGNLDSTSV
jgi:phosphoribosylformylglycinamidine (FGAM) synthase-like enzyme